MSDDTSANGGLGCLLIVIAVLILFNQDRILRIFEQLITPH